MHGQRRHLHVYGYGAETSTSAFVKGTVNDVDPSGLGIMSKDNSSTYGIKNNENTTPPNHSIDNWMGSSSSSSSDSSAGGAAYAEMLAISFSEAVNLTQVSAAWTYTDSDAMIFRWDGGGTKDLSNLSLSANQLPTTLNVTSNGWTLVAAGQFAGSNQYNNGATVGSINVPGSLYSSYWLVSTALGQSTGANNDGFKINQFTGNICAYTVTNGECKPPEQVPEPGTLALAAVAFLGLSITRRRRNAAR